VRRPKLLLLDEPLDSLDLPNQSSVAALISGSAEGGRHRGLVAHDVNPILTYLDGVVYVAKGAQSVPPRVITSTTLSRLYDPHRVLTTSDGRLWWSAAKAPAHHSDAHGLPDDCCAIAPGLS